MPEMSLIYSTFENLDDARAVGEDLVQRRFAACVNIIPGMISIYEWNNEFHNAEEVFLLIKTTGDKVGECMAEVRHLHPAETPAILELPVLSGDPDYLKWLRARVDPQRRA